MPVSLYVGNLPYTASEEGLRQLFSEVGSVESIRMPTDRETGRLRGFAFVEMASEEDARNAIRRFDGHMLDSRELRVNIAEERAPRTGSYGGRRGWR